MTHSALFLMRKAGSRCSQHSVMKNHFWPTYSLRSNRCVLRVNFTATFQCPPKGGRYIRASAVRSGRCRLPLVHSVAREMSAGPHIAKTLHQQVKFLDATSLADIRSQPFPKGSIQSLLSWEQQPIGPVRSGRHRRKTSLSSYKHCVLRSCVISILVPAPTCRETLPQRPILLRCAGAGCIWRRGRCGTPSRS
jgi:hypothetical protein